MVSLKEHSYGQQRQTIRRFAAHIEKKAYALAKACLKTPRTHSVPRTDVAKGIRELLSRGTGNEIYRLMVGHLTGNKAATKAIKEFATQAKNVAGSR